MCWRNCEELLSLFSIQPGKWTDRFVDMVEMGALVEHFGLATLSQVERGMLKELRISPLVFWSNIKRAVRPLVTASGETLRALGVPVEGTAPTSHEVAAAVVKVLSDKLDSCNEDIARQVAERLADYGF